MSKHVLYSFRRCPYAIRARMALAQAEINCELRELMLRDKPKDMLKHSPKGTVPVFITQPGQVIDESKDVMLWALQQNDPDDWLHDLEISLQLIEKIDHEFKPLLDRYKYADRHPEMTDSEHRDLTLPHIKALNEKLERSEFLLSNQITLADIAVFPFIRQYAFVNKKWFDDLPYTALKKWLQHFLDAELFHNIMPKCRLYNDGFSYQFPDYVLSNIKHSNRAL
ncbi:glutathione S-transferase [Marinicella sp. S1101]|uniref:glutathione S-transferase n=1 Tax=Marinicella marina TaxID=2996016 RepID=UPI002260F71F|nr:glutathione S-transferase [Marinicella marina]MCX7553748.1 glutathione S-transferase [Marinicella marina]MDJ1140823.1 glutathione S-transferase [Marinicella marina]